MDCVRLLEVLKECTEEALKDLLLPVRVQAAGEEASERKPDVFLMRLPDSKTPTKKAPYVLHQLVTQSNKQSAGEKFPDCKAAVRTVVCIYSDDEEEGSLMLLNVMERLRIRLMRDPILGKQFELDLQNGSLEYLIYPDNTAPYYMGEMATNWVLPPVKREVPETW